MRHPYPHRRGVFKYNMPRAAEPSGSTSSASAEQPTTSMTTDGSKELSLASSAIVASVASCFGVAILIIFGIYFYGRRRHKHRTKKTGFVFVEDGFADSKKNPSSPELDKYLMKDITKLDSSGLSQVQPHHHREPSSTSNDHTLGRQSQGSPPLTVANAEEDEKMSTPATLVFPKPVAQKGRPPRSKPAWLSPITIEEEVKTSPPAYMPNAAEEIFIPIPLQKSKLSVTLKSHASVRSKTSTKSLIIPDHEPVPVISPARSESFAPKDLALPSPPTPPATSTSSPGSQTGSSRVEHDTDAKLPRLMTVVCLFTPNFPDELYVKIGDTIRIIEEYKDGWCFVQFVGRKDAPKGMVPLVCLQERKRLVPLTHNASNKSLTSLNWRTLH